MTSKPKPTPDMPLLDYWTQHYFDGCRRAESGRKVFTQMATRVCRKVETSLGRAPSVRDLNADSVRRLDTDGDRKRFLAVWRFAADSGLVPIDDTYTRKKTGNEEKCWPGSGLETAGLVPQMALADFIRANYLPAEPSRKAILKMMLLLDHLSGAIDRPPVVADLNQIGLAALTYYLRNKRRLSLATVASAKQYFRSVWRCAAEAGLVPDLPRIARMGRSGMRKAARVRVLTKRLRERITTAVTMRASGQTWDTIAKHFRLTPEAIWGWRKRWPDFWRAESNSAMQAEIERVRTLAGSPQSIDIPDFARMVERCEKWAESEGQTLFPAPPPEVTASDPSMHTVPSFLESYMIPCCLTEATGPTVDGYRKCANKFARTMGNPPLSKITNLTLAA